MIKALLLAAAMAAAPVAGAAALVDTGTPDGSGFPLSLDGSNWFAGQVTFANAVSISAVRGWLNDMGGGGSFTVALYSDAANTPATLVQSAAASFTTASGGDGWNGTAGLNWNVAAGTYWAALEVGPADTFAGVAPLSAPSPLGRFAFNDGSGYRVVGGFAPGIQIDGTVAAVPEAESYALMLAGLGVLGFFARRRRV